MPISLTQRQQAWSDLIQAPEEVAEARRTADEQIERIQASDMYSDDYKSQLIQQQRDGVNQAIATAMQRVNEAREILLSASSELSGPQGDATTQLLSETRQQRAWARVRPQIEGGRAWGQVLAEAVQARDAATVLAMATEMPAWAQAQRKRPGGMASEGDLDLDGMHRALDVATFKALGDDKGPGTAARARLHVAAQYPVAQSVITQAAKGKDLNGALAVHYAKNEAAAIEAQLGDPAAD